MKFLVIGDFHIPERSAEIPRWIRKIIEKEKFDMVLCTGDLTGMKVINYLAKLAPVKYVLGNMDTLQLPESELIAAKGLRLLLVHGTEVHPRGDLPQLNELRKEAKADLLVCGHTHTLRVDEYEGKLFINPGTATGVWGGVSGATDETFIIMEIEKNNVNLQLFKNGKLFKKISFVVKK
ncbi:MAG: YfcE family phosphodiesterase [Candidatus Micrarchaeota archaeon]